ncbi:hypothetical protein [Rubellicoccus peritrichatus]|uniref:Uncharacterized protein n=1 Tax=Rubellicoccus peritrichatus TaxID=3080537 RepID=A0AAQ3QTP8_9BACT|nr:hypothetical protein [Puniceicoccus sp. CR14]WOO39618.1 hypothetical protein RZN69_13420 [Puniceicoccus sp. CR14]
MSKPKNFHVNLQELLSLFQRTFLVFCFLLPLGSSSAQEEPPVSMAFRMYSLGDAIRDIYYFDGKDYRKIVVPNNQRSPSFNYRGPEEVQFFRATSNEEGEILYHPVASTLVDPSLKRVFMIFVADSDDDAPFRVYNVEDSFRTSMSDNWLILNLTPKQLVSRIEADITPFALVPGNSHFVKPTPRDNKSYLFSVAEYVDEEWKVVYNATWPHREGKRAIVFILPRGNNPEGIKVQHLYESILPAPSPPQ